VALAMDGPSLPRAASGRDRDGSAGDGSAGDGSAGDGSAGDGSAGDGSALDGSPGVGSAAGSAPAGRVVTAPPVRLTPREREIVALIAAGLSNRAIAAELVISPATAARHVANILGKLGFTSRAQIAAWGAVPAQAAPGALPAK
jgi:DNA-binding CsgD family transcriptional regulator